MSPRQDAILKTLKALGIKKGSVKVELGVIEAYYNKNTTQREPDSMLAKALLSIGSRKSQGYGSKAAAAEKYDNNNNWHSKRRSIY